MHMHGTAESEAAPVNGTWAVLAHGSKMPRCRIAFVLGESISGILAIQLDHNPISGDFGQHAGGGDAIASGISFDERGMRKAQ